MKAEARHSVMDKRDYALLLCYLYTGLRGNEVISLRGKDLDWQNDRLLLMELFKPQRKLKIQQD